MSTKLKAGYGETPSLIPQKTSARAGVWEDGMLR